MIIWILFAIIVLLAAVMIFYYGLNKQRYQFNYYNIFIMGIIWVVAGVPLQSLILTILGGIFAIWGLINKQKWPADKRRLKQLSPQQQKIRTLLIGFIIVVLIIGIVALYFAK